MPHQTRQTVKSSQIRGFATLPGIDWQTGKLAKYPELARICASVQVTPPPPTEL